MFQNFILTYSVKAQTDWDSDKEKAAKVRNEIADLDCWDKIGEVETTFSGRANLRGATESEMKSSAKNEVKEFFLPILKKHNASEADVKIFCAMMTEKIDTPFEFVIKY